MSAHVKMSIQRLIAPSLNSALTVKSALRYFYFSTFKLRSPDDLCFHSSPPYFARMINYSYQRFYYYAVHRVLCTLVLGRIYLLTNGDSISVRCIKKIYKTWKILSNKNSKSYEVVKYLNNLLFTMAYINWELLTNKPSHKRFYKNVAFITKLHFVSCARYVPDIGLEAECNYW